MIYLFMPKYKHYVKPCPVTVLKEGPTWLFALLRWRHYKENPPHLQPAAILI